MAAEIFLQPGENQTMTKRILVPTDFSTLGQSALEAATALAKERDAELMIVHVEEPPSAYAYGEFYIGADEPDRSALEAMLAEVRPADPAVPCTHRLLVGSPAKEIVKLAASEKVDMIVMPTHGRTGLARVLMGSVAEEVVRKANCPVLTIKGAKPALQKA
jgi:nucleotide-binding universal stress UspA family protein